MLKKIFKNVGKADKNIWGYVKKRIENQFQLLVKKGF